MKILVTGANGYLGQGIVKALLNRGITVIANDFNLDSVDERAVKIQGNIFECSTPYEYFECPDVVLHLAWRNGFVHNNQSHVDDLPLHYSFLLRLINAGIKQVSVLGTMHEIGFHEGPIDENTPCNPQNLYGIAKNALRCLTELECKNKGIAYQWIRGFYIVGNTKAGASIFSKITQAEERGEQLFPFTSGKNQYDFIDYDEMCGQVASIVSQNKVTGVINACSGYPEKLSVRVEDFIRENLYKIRLNYGVYPDRPYDSKAVWGCDKKIKEIKNNEAN